MLIGPSRWFFDLAQPTNRIEFTFAKTLPVTEVMRYMWMGLFITTNSTSTVIDRYDFVLDWRYPNASELDNSHPVKGNLVPNSSFEVGVGSGWGLHSQPYREESVAEIWATNAGIHGWSSMGLTLPSNRWLQATSKPFSALKMR